MNNTLFWCSIFGCWVLIMPSQAQPPTSPKKEETAISRQVTAETERITRIQANWQQRKPQYTGTPFAEKPNLNPPYSTGVLHKDFVQDGVNMVNFVRFVAGVPDDVTADTETMRQAQYGALLLAVGKEFSHTPKKPDAMSEEMYQTGYHSTGSSNIGNGYRTVEDSIRSYMKDSDSGNIDRLGHRRWILNPPLQKIGFGFVNNYTTTQIFDRSRTTPFSAQAVGWPCPGVFPVEFFSANDAWSVSLNSEIFQEPNIAKVRVSLKRLSDGTRWMLHRDMIKPSNSPLYFNVDLGGYGMSYCIIFRPNQVTRYKQDERYEVEITGLRYRNGNTEPLRYSVRFFSLTPDRSTKPRQ